MANEGVMGLASLEVVLFFSIQNGWQVGSIWAVNRVMDALRQSEMKALNNPTY